MKTKRLFQVLSVITLTLLVTSINAQVVKTKTRDYKKAVKQRTKDYEKQGFKPMGSGTIKLYVTKGVNKEFETDDDGQYKNAVVTTKEVGPTFESASEACHSSAKTDLAGDIETRVAELVKRSVANDEISETSADGINKIVAAGKQLIAQRISMEDIYTFYRPVKDSRTGDNIVEVVYSGYYSKKLAMQTAQKYIRDELKKESNDLYKDLDNIFKQGDN